MSEKKLEIVAIATSEFQENSFVVILKELGAKRRIPVVIGTFEAQAIVVAIQDIASNRPLTHDLFRHAIIALGGHLEKVVIAELNEGIFYSTLHIQREDGRVEQLDSRTSDALALAVRFKAPIYTTEKILDEAGVVMNDHFDVEEEEAAIEELSKELENPFGSLSDEELQEQLTLSLEEEAYEKAAQIRDELNRRSS